VEEHRLRRHRAARNARGLQQHGASGSTEPLSASAQRQLAEDARGGGLPPWIIAGINQHKLSHVILVTRNRGDTNLRTADGEALGRTRVDGIGFYLDGEYSVRNPQTGVVNTGIIGSHVLVQLTMMEVESAEIVRSYLINDQRLLTGKEAIQSGQPWDQLSSEEKVQALRGSLDQSLKRVLPGFIKGP
jgi:hypothetical protein